MTADPNTADPNTADPNTAGPNTADPNTAGPNTAGLAAALDLRVTGMHCESCSGLLEDVLGDLEGVEGAAVDLEGGAARITYRPASVTPEAIVAAITGAGYGAAPVSRAEDRP